MHKCKIHKYTKAKMSLRVRIEGGLGRDPLCAPLCCMIAHTLLMKMMMGHTLKIMMLMIADILMMMMLTL